MNKAAETKARRKAALATLGAGWKAEKGVEGAKDLYSHKASGIIILPRRTVDGNFYIGSHKRGFTFADTLSQAATIAASWM